jgi:phage regulator Rha-like protein
MMNEVQIFNSVVESKVVVLRNQHVILDSDVAELYDVETKHVNQAVSNNPEKFPEGYVFELQNAEKQEVVESFHHLEKLKFSPIIPKAFTEKGLYMLATILKSKRATETTIEIVETFAKMRELSRTVGQLARTDDKEQQNALTKRGSSLIADLLGSEMQTTGGEIGFELNLAILKVKGAFSQEKKRLTLQLKEAKELLDTAAITAEEYEKLKVKILDKS